MLKDFRLITFLYYPKSRLREEPNQTLVLIHPPPVPVRDFYSGESWNNQITVIDNRFISERVNQLRNWNINFVHTDIRNVEAVREFLKEADVVHHLAGITDVARTKEESNPDKDKEMNDVAEKGTSVILSEITSIEFSSFSS